MNTQTNIAIAQQAYADFSAGNIPALLAALSEDVVWSTPGKGLPTEGTRHGKEEVRRFFGTVAETWLFESFQLREYIASGDVVSVIGSYTATARSTGKTVSTEWVTVWRFREGKVVSFREFTDTHALLEAVSRASPARTASAR